MNGVDGKVQKVTGSERSRFIFNDRIEICLFAGLWERWERPPARQGELRIPLRRLRRC